VTEAVKTRLSEKPRIRLTASMQRGQRAFFDAAATNRLTEKHWQHASEFDIDTLIRGDLATLRKRARYEICNNGYGAGITDTLTDYLVGTGPVPQIDSGSEAFDEECEARFADWCQDCDYTQTLEFGELLRMQMVGQPCEAGGSLTILKNDPQAGPYEVSLRLLAVAMERLANPFKLGGDTRKLHDGIQFDDAGRPLAYYILKDHPNSGYTDSLYEHDRVSAMQVIHLFRVMRPGQHLGLPWLTPALSLFANLRRFTLATIDAAETAASLAGILKNTHPGIDPGDAEDIDSNDVIELERNALLTTPMGWDMQQMKPEHPATTYKMFKNEIINEIARCVNMPFNIAAANSSEYNYASGRLDHQAFFRFITTTRSWGQRRFLKRVFSAWLTEAFLIPGYFKTRPTFEQAMAAARGVEWHWPGFKHVDPTKEAKADEINLAVGSTTLADIYADKGQDWRKKIIQRGKEIALMKEHGVPLLGAVQPEIEDDDDDETSAQKDKSQNQ
jgi:lambda family phage portal protein